MGEPARLLCLAAQSWPSPAALPTPGTAAGRGFRSRRELGASSSVNVGAGGSKSEAQLQLPHLC